MEPEGLKIGLGRGMVAGIDLSIPEDDRVDVRVEKGYEIWMVDGDKKSQFKVKRREEKRNKEQLLERVELKLEATRLKDYKRYTEGSLQKGIYKALQVCDIRELEFKSTLQRVTNTAIKEIKIEGSELRLRVAIGLGVEAELIIPGDAFLELQEGIDTDEIIVRNKEGKEEERIRVRYIR